MTYRAPLADIGFALKQGAALKSALDDGMFGDLTEDVVDAVLAEAGRLAGEVIAPLNRVGDTVGVTFKHILLPVWLASYRFYDKTYRVMVNGQTGEVMGDRPYSWVKITALILTILAAIGLIVFLVMRMNRPP